MNNPAKTIFATRWLLVPLLWLAALSAGTQAANFSSGTEPAVKFGVHEIALTGRGDVANPFDVIASVTFQPPSGAAQAKTVFAFFDGANTWRARVYVSEPGAWTWSSKCDSDPLLAGRSGAFTAGDSQLRGRLLPHPQNPHHWITENGRWFLNLNDTAYQWLSASDRRGQPIPDAEAHEYIRDLDAHGITSIRSFLYTRSAGPRGRDTDTELKDIWRDAFFTDDALSHLQAANFQSADRRLRWLLDEYPQMYVQAVLFPMGCRYANDQEVWQSLTPQQRERLMRNIIARYAAYPQIFWLSVNDLHHGPKYPLNNAFAQEVGEYFRKHDPWRHPFSAGHARRVTFAFPDADWIDYLHLEDEHALAGEQVAKYYSHRKPVFLGEDRYEQDHGPSRDPSHMDYWQRRLFWAWLLAGGSANYGGRYWVIEPYAGAAQRPTFRMHRGETRFEFPSGLHGLDSVKAIRDYFSDRNIELSDYEPKDALVKDAQGGEGVRAPKLMHRGRDEFLVYHPHAAEDGQHARPRDDTAALTVDLREAPGRFSVEWYRAADGAAQAGEPVMGGDWRQLTAPWAGSDCILRLRRSN